MKLLLVLGSDDSYDIIAHYVRPLGFELIRYRHVIKAMDNIDEINPTAIVMSAKDFPRHWKVLLQFVRSERSKEDCPIVILNGKDFPSEEVAKAFFLGVSGLVNEDLEEPSERTRLQKILSRYVSVMDKRRFYRFDIEPWHQLGFLIVNPKDKAVITGSLKTISQGGLSFSPTSSSMMKDIMLDMVLEECSLRVGDTVLAPVCKLVRTGRIVSLEFVSFPGDEEKTLIQYLEELPMREFKMKKED